MIKALATICNAGDAMFERATHVQNGLKAAVGQNRPQSCITSKSIDIRLLSVCFFLLKIEDPLKL